MGKIKESRKKEWGEKSSGGWMRKVRRDERSVRSRVEKEKGGKEGQKAMGWKSGESGRRLRSRWEGREGKVTL